MSALERAQQRYDDLEPEDDDDLPADDDQDFEQSDFRDDEAAFERSL
mgnify:CR=1 FL=1